MLDAITIPWKTCRQDFEWGGSWRDIYITPASLDDWNAIFPLLRAQPEFELLNGSGVVPEMVGASFFTEPPRAVRFRIGGVRFVFHFFTPGEIECDIDPREVTGQASLDAVVAFMRQMGDLTRKRVVLTPENAPTEPIISYDPERGELRYHPDPGNTELRMPGKIALKKYAISRSLILYVVFVGLLALLRFVGALRKLTTAEVFYGPALFIASCWILFMIVGTVHGWVERGKPDA